MFYKEILKKSIHYYDTLLISTILSIITVPSLWYISHGNLAWVLSCTVLWAIGIFIIFQPAIRYLLPYMLTQIGTIASIFILASISIILNVILIMFFIPSQDVDMIMSMAIFSSTINNIFLFAWFYIVVAVTLLLNLDFRVKKISNLFSIHSLEYFIEMILIFILPVAFLFWTNLTYSFRILLGIMSATIGVTLFVYKMESESVTQKVLASIVYMVIILIINSTIINSFGINGVTERSIKARIDGDKILLDLEAKNIKHPSFQLSNNPRNSGTDVYKIFASLPLLNLNLGYRVATIPNGELSIQNNSETYTVYDQYNHKKLLVLDK